MAGDGVELIVRRKPAPRAAGRRTSVKRGVLLVGGLLVITLLASQACQRAPVRVSQTRAIAIARAHVHFTAKRTQIRLVRQGISSHPYWAVSLSIAGLRGGYRKLAVVEIDANSGAVTSIVNER